MSGWDVIKFRLLLAGQRGRRRNACRQPNTLHFFSVCQCVCSYATHEAQPNCCGGESASQLFVVPEIAVYSILVSKLCAVSTGFYCTGVCLM